MESGNPDLKWGLVMASDAREAFVFSVDVQVILSASLTLGRWLVNQRCFGVGFGVCSVFCRGSPQGETIITRYWILGPLQCWESLKNGSLL